MFGQHRDGDGAAEVGVAEGLSVWRGRARCPLASQKPPGMMWTLIAPAFLSAAAANAWLT